MTKQITQSEYIQLEGLAAIRNKHLAALYEIEDIVHTITKEDDKYGHSSDFVWREMPTKDLLTKLGVTVVSSKAKKR